jgi:hypothetical protein
MLKFGSLLAFVFCAASFASAADMPAPNLPVASNPTPLYDPSLTITSDDPRLFALVHRSVVILIAPTRERAISDAREFVEFIHEQVDLGPARRPRRWPNKSTSS